MAKYIHRFQSLEEYLEAVNGKVETVSGLTSGEYDNYTYEGVNPVTGRQIWACGNKIIELEQNFTTDGYYHAFNADGTVYGDVYLERSTFEKKYPPQYIEPWLSFTEGAGVNFNWKYEYVDLGLSVLWATSNVGAFFPEAVGGYYAWGETWTKDTYGWDGNYIFSGTGADHPSKYSPYGAGHDGKSALDPEDDAATVVMGSRWRTPTPEEIFELDEGTNKEWVVSNGVSGCRFTSKVDSSKSIFIPATGLYNCEDNWEDGPLVDLGCIHLWTNSQASYPWMACEMTCCDNDGFLDNYRSRCSGIPVRGVMDK